MEKLKRYPSRSDDLLQAWESADELLLEEVVTLAPKPVRILLVQDQFGALASGLDGHEIVSLTDSYVSFKGSEMNTHGRIKPQNNWSEIEGKFDLVLIKIPSNLSYFEDLLANLRPHLDSSSRVICGVMVKHQVARSFELLQKYVGATHTSLAKKKARLIFAKVEKDPQASPYPVEVSIDSFPKPFLNHANLFSREKLDIGTRFFLEHIPAGDYGTILDLGCANGILGIRAKEKNPGAEIIFSDDSFQAITSSKMNYARYFDDEARFEWTNCYENGEKDSLDLVLCNPPFHQQRTVGDHIAWQMFQDSFRCLKKDGLLRVIGNSHLGYAETLKKIFGNSKTIATNSKFMIIDALKK